MPHTHHEKIFLVEDSGEEKFLRKKTQPLKLLPNGGFSCGDAVLSKKELNDLILRMKRIMRDANGVGLSANQIGLPYRLFVASVLTPDGNIKFYAILNPRLEKADTDMIAMEEGCLSVPGVYGDVERPGQIVVSGIDKHGRAVKIKAWGLLARVFQHEIDHLDGALFIDKAKNLQRVDAPQ